MDSIRGTRIIGLVLTLLIGIVLYKIVYEFWISRVIDYVIGSFVDLSVCESNFNEPECDTVFSRFRTIEHFFSWSLKYFAFFFLSFYLSRLIIGNRSIVGLNFLVVVLLGLSSIVIPFTITDGTVSGISAFMSILPIGVGCLYFVYSNRKLHNKN